MDESGFHVMDVKLTNWGALKKDILGSNLVILIQ